MALLELAKEINPKDVGEFLHYFFDSRASRNVDFRMLLEYLRRYRYNCSHRQSIPRAVHDHDLTHATKEIQPLIRKYQFFRYHVYTRRDRKVLVIFPADDRSP